MALPHTSLAVAVKASGWWLGLALLAPIALPQALYARRNTLRLPPAAGPQQGLAGAQFQAVSLRLLVLGESTAAGVGVSQQVDALAGQLAHTLAVRLERPVQWRALGENGITATQFQQRLLPDALTGAVDLAVVALGVNDCTGLSSLRTWSESQAAIARALQQQGAHVAFCAVPALEQFTALPRLLGRLLGVRAVLMNCVLARVAAERGATFHPLSLEFSEHFLAGDGFHPSALGYQRWAQALVDDFVANGLL